MKLSRFLLGASLLLTLGGCPAVYVEQPVGDEPVKLDAADWNGTWISTDEALVIRVQDSENGILEVAWIESEGEQLVMKAGSAHVREGGGQTFISLKDEEATETRYLWGILVRHEAQLLVLAPDAEKFGALVMNGKLAGKIDPCSSAQLGECDVYLSALEPEHLDLILSEQEGFLFDWDEPLVLTRLGR